MYPDLLEIFGITLYGLTFERCLWGFLCLMMAWGVVSSIVLVKQGRRGEGAIQGLIVSGVLIWSGLRFVSTFSPGYVLLFQEPLVLHSYALCVLIGVGLGLWTAKAMGERRGLDGRALVKLCLMLVGWGFVGARLAHVVVDWEPYWNACFAPELAGLSEPNCLRVLNVAEGGLTFYGGVIAGMFVVAWAMMKRRRAGQPLELLSHLDALAGALAISHAFGRLGCLAAGCCWGAVTTGKLGVHYGADSHAFAALLSHPDYHDAMMKTGQTPLLHATQIYESLGELVLYGVLWALIVRGTRPGKMVGIWFMGYGVIRFIVECMRDDAERGYFFERRLDWVNRALHVVPDHATILTTSQGIGLVMIVIGAILFYVGSKASK